MNHAAQPWVRKEVIGNATLYLGDCLEILPTLPVFDAVVTDPPYGLGKRLIGGNRSHHFKHDVKVDISTILAAGRRAVIWGGNYYSLPPSRGWLCWYKPDAVATMGQIELAWSSMDRNAKHIRCSIAETNCERVGHPTQKPELVMRASIDYLGATVHSIVDPFMGSGTTGAASVQCGVDEFIGIEIEPKYFDIACERIENAQRQQRMFA